VTLREEHRLRIIQDKVLRKIFGHQGRRPFHCNYGSKIKKKPLFHVVIFTARHF